MIMEEEKFTIREAKGNDHYIIMIVNETLKFFNDKSSIPWFLFISVDIKDKTGRYELPTSQEAKVLDSIQNKFNELIGSTTVFKYVGRITGDGKRELYYYIENPEEINAKLTEIIQNRDYVREFEYSIIKDTEWKRVSFFFDY